MANKNGRKPYERVKVDQGKLKELTRSKGMSFCDLSEKCGKEKGYISHTITRNSSEFEVTFFKLMCLILHVEEDELLYKESKEVTSNIDTSVFIGMEQRIIDKIESMQTQIDVLEVELTKTRKLCESLEIEIQGTRKASTNASNMAVAIREEMKSLSGYDPLAKAKKLITEMLDNGYAEETEILSEADKVGISKADMLAARKQMDVQTSFKGYGKNQKTTWIKGK